MAIDTAARRFSIMDFDIPSQPGMMPPDGSITQPDRQSFLWLYGGIALAPPGGFQAAWARRVNTVIAIGARS